MTRNQAVKDVKDGIIELKAVFFGRFTQKVDMLCCQTTALLKLATVQQGGMEIEFNHKATSVHFMDLPVSSPLIHCMIVEVYEIPQQ